MNELNAKKVACPRVPSQGVSSPQPATKDARSPQRHVAVLPPLPAPPPPPPCSDGSRSRDGCPPGRRDQLAPTWAKACSRCSNASLTPRGSPAHNHRDSLPCPRRNRHAQCRRRTTRVSVTSARTMSMSSLGSGLTCLKTHGANQHQPSTSATAPAPQHQHQHQHQPEVLESPPSLTCARRRWPRW